MTAQKKPLWIGSLTALVLALLFAFWAWATLTGTAIEENDEGVAQYFQGVGSVEKALRIFMIVMTHVGGIPAMTGLALALTVWQLVRRRYLLTLACVLVPLLGSLINLALKTTIDRDRPPPAWRDEAVTETNDSFPSGHAMGSTIGFGLLAYLACLEVQSIRRRVLIVALLTLVVLGIGASRVFLRAHWLSDVVGGFLIGAAWLALCLGIVETIRRSRLSETSRQAVTSR